MVKKITTILLLAAAVSSGSANAGFAALTHHSRANCASFNETISWHYGHSYWLWVVSRHRFENPKHESMDHQVINGWIYGSRAAAYHTNEGYGGWTVEGHHWMRENEGSLPFQVAQEFIADCSIYDGWWD